MTTISTDQAKTAYAETHSMAQAAAKLGVHPSTVSRRLKAAGVVVEPPPVNALLQREIILARSFHEKTAHLLALLDAKEDEAGFRDVIVGIGVLEDKRYRLEHPESVAGVNVNVDQRTVSFTFKIGDGDGEHKLFDGVDTERVNPQENR